MNRKIKNATPKEFDGIKFKSLLEVLVYKTLKAYGFNPEYERCKYRIWNGMIPTIPFYTKNTFKRKNSNIKVESHNLAIDMRPLSDITYTPDFEFFYNGKHIIIEVKGFQNDVFGYKFKMFREFLELRFPQDTVELWEIFSKKQLLECIEHLKDES